MVLGLHGLRGSEVDNVPTPVNLHGFQTKFDQRHFTGTRTKLYNIRHTSHRNEQNPPKLSVKG